MCDIAANTEYEELFREAGRLQETLSALILERDELKYHICPDIQADYMLKFGALEYKILELQYKILRIKRQMELIQLQINLQKIVNTIEIEVQLDNEFHEYQERLNNKLDEMNAAFKRDNIDRLTEEQTREIRRLYNKIVKKLHPDMNPNVTEREKELFVHATEAYKNGDLETIRTIALMIDDLSQFTEITDSMKELREKIDRLNWLISNIEHEIWYIKQQFPYDQKELLSNPDRVEARKKELEKILEEYKEAYEYYEKKLHDMMEDLNDG